MQLFHTDQFVLPLPPGHRFPSPKYRLLHERVLATLPDMRIAEAPPASDGELALAHTPGYIDAVLRGTLSAAEQREIGFPWTERMAQRAVRSVGATIAAARVALREGVAGQTAGGTHHAYAHKGSGFCVFNDVAVAARLMQAEAHRHRPHPGSLLRVLVLDLDVHQGNGTAAIFRDDPTVVTVSLHGERNFPFRKEASSLDVALPDGCTDAPYLAALRGTLAQLDQRLAAQPPGLLFYLAGADPHEGDRLGRLKLTAGGLAERDEAVFAWARARQLPLVVVMAGGYGHDIHTTVALQLTTLRLALAHWQQGQGRAGMQNAPP